MLFSAFVAAIIVLIAAPLPTIYSLIEDSVVAGYLGYSIIPFSLIVSRKNGAPVERRIIKNELGGYIIAILAFMSASLIVFWSGWPADPYAIALLAIIVITSSIMYKVKENFVNSLWFVGYILFMIFMSYIGSVGALKILSFVDSTIIVLAVCLFVFFPLGIHFGIRHDESIWKAET